LRTLVAVRRYIKKNEVKRGRTKTVWWKEKVKAPERHRKPRRRREKRL